MHGFHIKHDQVDDFLLLKIESGGKSTYITHLLMLLSLPTLRISPTTQIIFTTHSFNNLSPIPKSFIRYRHQRDRTDRKS